MSESTSGTSSEARFRALTEDSADAILVLDARGAITYWSPSAERITGLTSAEMLDGRIFDRVHPDDLEAAVAAFGTMLSEPGDIGLDEFRYRDAEGQWLRMEMSARNLLDHPAVRGMVLNARDVTQTRALEGHYLRSQRFQAMSRVVRGLAYDVSKLTDALDTEVNELDHALEQDSPGSGSVRRIRTLLEKAGELTGEMIAFSSGEAMQPQSVSVARLLDRVEQEFRTIVGKGFDLTVSPPDVSVSAYCDPVQFEQAVLNLLLNARDATPLGGRIRLAAAPGPDEERITIRVTDEGEGIAPGDLDRIFEPFFTTREAGTGLGLTMVEGAVEQAGGQIHVESTPGEGTTFELHLPASEPAPASRHSARATAENPAVLAGARVALADSRLSRRTLMGSALRQHGAQVVEVPSGARIPALLDYEEQEIHILITELLGPAITGGELVNALRKRGLSIPVLFLCSGRGDQVDEHLALNPDVPALRTPFRPVDLIQQVRSMWDHDVPASMRSTTER